MRTRLHALWRLRLGQGPTAGGRGGGQPQCRADVAVLVPVRRTGRGAVPSAQAEQLVVAAATGMFATAQAVRDWIEAQFGVAYTVGKPVHAAAAAGDPAEGAPAPAHAGGSPGPDGLEKGGLGARLKAVGLKAGQGLVC